jgi:choline dehydrogenase
VTIVSNNPNDPPHINPNYLNTTDDIAVALYAFKNLRKVVANFASTTNFTIGAYNGEVRPGPTVQSDEDIVHYIRETSIQIWHASGTCSMLPQAQGGVVDSKLRVYGVQGLRVVDASVIPVVPDAHTQAAVYMIAEKAADLILSGV